MTDQAREAAKEIYEAQTDTGRTFDNSYTEQEIYAVIQRACDKSYALGLSAGREQHVAEGGWRSVAELYKDAHIELHAYNEKVGETCCEFCEALERVHAVGATQPEVK